ncbi:MAG: reverse transcriptase family protein [Porphyromonas sp.]|nr:reverse transcriptase family protein [Porphyromonas sp.]
MYNAALHQRLRRLRSPQQFLDLLHALRLADCTGLDDIEPRYWTLRELRVFASPWIPFRYHSFEIPKKSGGVRRISAPARTKYRVLLYYVNQLLKSIYKPNDYAMGFVAGRSIVSNAAQHLGQNYVYNIDLKDFFPSITESRIRQRLRSAPYELSELAACLISGLATMSQSSRDVDTDKQVVRYVLPQGSPISPILTNIVCERLDRRLAGLAKRFGLRYSRYADDITFSSSHNVYHTGGDFDLELRRIIANQGFAINEGKVRLQKRGARQEVTGLRVGERVNVSKDYIRSLRSILYIWERYGYADASDKFRKAYMLEKAGQIKGEPSMEAVLGGKLQFLRMVRGAEDKVYCRLAETYQRLLAELRGVGVEEIKVEPLLSPDATDALHNLSLCLDEVLS